MDAVNRSARHGFRRGPSNRVTLDSLRKKLDALLTDAYGAAGKPDRRLELIDLLDEGRESIARLTQLRSFAKRRCC